MIQTNNKDVPSAEDDAFYEGALPRIRRYMLVIAPAAAVVIFGVFGWRVGAGFVVGCVIAYVNFHWLKQGVNALADRITQSGVKTSGRGIVVRFLLRYFLIALGAYAIFKVSAAGVYGLLGGLFLPVAAILCEAAYELYAAVRRGL